MKVINAIIQKVGRFDYKVILVYEDGTRKELPATMPLRTAVAVRKLFRK